MLSKIQFLFPFHEVLYKILLHYSIAITCFYIVKNDFYNIFISTELQYYLYIWTAFWNAYHLLLHFQHLIILNSRMEAPSKAFLLLFHAKSLATMETVLTAHFVHFFPSVLIRNSYLLDSIRYPMYTHFKKKTTLASLYYLHNDIKDRKVIKHDIFYTFKLSQRKGTEIQGDCSEILAEVWVFCLFHPEVLFPVISHTGIQHYFLFPGRWIRQGTVYNNTEREIISIEQNVGITK